MVVVKFNRTIRQSGGSAAIAVPPELLNALDWKIGDQVELYADEQELVIKKDSSIIDKSVRNEK